MKNKGYLALTTCLIDIFPIQAEKSMLWSQVLCFLIRNRLYGIFLKKKMLLWWQSKGLNITKDFSLSFSKIICSYQLNLSLLSSRQIVKRLNFSLLSSPSMCLLVVVLNKVILPRFKILVLWNGMIKFQSILLSWGFSARFFKVLCLNCSHHWSAVFFGFWNIHRNL